MRCHVRLTSSLHDTSSHHAPSDQHAVTPLFELHHLCTDLILEDVCGLCGLRPMCAVAAWGSQRARIQIDVCTCEIATELRVFVVEVLHSIAELVAIPIDDHHVAILPCE